MTDSGGWSQRLHIHGPGPGYSVQTVEREIMDPRDPARVLFRFSVRLDVSDLPAGVSVDNIFVGYRDDRPRAGGET